MSGVLGCLARAARPHQWVKNLFVFAPLFFSEGWVGREIHEIATSGQPSGLTLRVTATFALFCLLSSGVYLMNDVLDREADRAHPVKRLRPVASGELPASVAAGASAVLILLALAWARFGLERTPLLGVCLFYVVIQVLYSFWLKRVVILDVMCIA